MQMFCIPLNQFDIEVRHPDFFISDLIDLNELKAMEAFTNQVRNLKNPPKTKQEILEVLSRAGLVQSASKLKAILLL